MTKHKVKRQALRSEEEHWLNLGLLRAGLPVGQVTDYLNTLYSTARTKASNWAHKWNHSRTVIPSKFKPVINKHVEKLKATPYVKPPRASAVKLKKLPEVGAISEVPPLSRAAQKALEAKLVQHRFRLETPKQTVELSVAGEGANDLFNKIVAVISEGKENK
jgi:hypothetical protein